MNPRAAFHLISYMVIFISVAMGLAAGVSWAYADPVDVRQGLLAAAGVCLLLGALLNVLTRGRSLSLSRKDGFAIVAFGWLVVAIVGSLPYLFTDTIPHPVDAVFETMSGFTTTGVSVLGDVESVPKGVLFWRAMTQWLGGMGVLLLCVAILPFLGVGGMQIYRAEVAGPTKDRLTPRIATTAKLLYGVYVLLTVAQTLLLTLAGMDFFDAMCHAFTTLATGGFSTRNQSMGAYESSPILVITIVFMVLGGTNFALHYRAIRGEPGAYWRSSEFRVYLAVLLSVTVFIAVDLGWAEGVPWGEALLHSLFQVASFITSTGFATRDYDQWSLASRLLLFGLLFSGACAGSTSGGIKLLRTMVMVKEAFRHVRLFLQPQAVLRVRIGRETVSAGIVASIVSFIFVYFAVFVVVTWVMAFFLPDVWSAGSAVATCMGNVGVSFGSVGPTCNYAHVATLGKVILSTAMLLGRLELFTLLVLFYPSFWKR